MEDHQVSANALMEHMIMELMLVVNVIILGFRYYNIFIIKLVQKKMEILIVVQEYQSHNAKFVIVTVTEFYKGLLPINASATQAIMMMEKIILVLNVIIHGSFSIYIIFFKIYFVFKFKGSSRFF